MEGATIEDLYQKKFKIRFKHLINIGCSKENTEDIAQNTFYKAIENMMHLEVSNLSAWLFKVSINQFYDICRRQQRFPKVNIDDAAFIATFVQEETGEDFLLQKEFYGDIRNMLDELKPSYKNGPLSNVGAGVTSGRNEKMACISYPFLFPSISSEA